MRAPILVLLLLLAACATQEPAQKVQPEPLPAPPTAEELAQAAAQARAKLKVPPGVDESALDTSADPCGDFYRFACGGWEKTTEIPDDRPLNSRGFVAIQDRNEQVLKQILEEAAANKLPEGTPFATQLSDYYSTCMDEPKLEASLPLVKKFIQKHSSPKSPKELAKLLGLLHAQGISPLFSVGSMQDLKNSTEVIGALDQGGLGLPDRDYYLDEDPKKRSVREAYLAHTEEMLVLYGETAAAAKTQATQILELETKLAKASQSRVERRDPANIYHRLEGQALEQTAPHFDWNGYFAALGQPRPTSLNLTSLAYFQELSNLVKQTPPHSLRAYLTWTLLRSSVPALPKKFQDAQFAYLSKNLTGAKADRPRWKKCVSFVDQDLGEALGREFVRRTFGEDGKARTNAMVQALQGAVKANLGTLAWMDAVTRGEAEKKLSRMVANNKIGYPGKWRDYSSLKTTRDSFMGNSLAANAFEMRRELSKIGQPVDRDEWLMSPSTVNAYYQGQKNEIVFPAGILQPPFFNREATDAVNFGAMGMVVGHEITHGFDDKGRKFDAEGNLRDWWSPQNGQAFVERAACVKKQFDEYVAVDDLKVKGDLTLGENVADAGGLKLAHAAMVNWYGTRGDSDDGYRYTRSQQFFLGFAQSWCTKVRPETARVRVTTDTHAPPYWRVVGPLANSDAFKQAFSCKEGSPMVRPAKERCEVW